MKKIVSILLLVAMLASLTACGNIKLPFSQPSATDPAATQPSGSTESQLTYDGSEVTIKFAHTMGAKLQEELNYHIGEFNKLYPNITIEHESYGGWGDISGQINTEIMADNQPNIAYCYPDHVASYNMSKSVVVLDSWINNTAVVERADGTTEIMGLTAEQINDFIDGFYAEGAQYGDGLMYTLPLSKSTEVLYYNKTFFEKHGLSVPTNWVEMEALCAKLLELDPKCIPLGYDSEDNLFITMCEQYGYPYTSATGEHYLFNNDQCKSFVKMIREWYQKGYMTTEALYGAYTSGLFTELDKDITHSYMCIGSSGGAGYQIPADKAFEVGVAPIPQVSEDNQKVISQGPSVCILKGGKTSQQQIAASWLFVKYLTTNLAFQTGFSEKSGYMPVLESAKDVELYADFLNRANGYEQLPALVIKVALEEADTYFTSPAFNGSSVARKQVGALLAKCMSQKTDNVDSLINGAFQAAYDECMFMGG